MNMCKLIKIELVQNPTYQPMVGVGILYRFMQILTTCHNANKIFNKRRLYNPSPSKSL